MLADVLYKLMLYGFLLVFFASAYAILYGFGRVWDLPFLTKISYAFGVLQFLSGLGMVVTEYLAIFWKLIILISSILYLFIPPVMWKVVVKFHERHHR